MLKLKTTLISSILAISLSLFAFPTVGFLTVEVQAEGSAKVFTMVSQKSTPSDVIDTNFEEAVSVVNSLGILGSNTTGSFKPEENMTRADYTAAVIRLIGMEDISNNSQQTLFEDVKDSYWASGYIKTAFDLGIIQGTSENKFSPDEPIAYELAVKMLVSALGYDVMAQAKGGFPSGYLVQAIDLKITNKTLPKDGNLTRGYAVKMLYNALEAPLLKGMLYSDKTSYTSDKAETALTEHLKMQKKTGIVNAVGGSRINYGINLSDGEIEIGSVIYNVGKLDFSQLLGRKVTFYAKDDTNQDKQIIICALKYDSENDEVTVNAEDYNMDFNALSCEYWKSSQKDKIETLNIIPNMSVVYNGKYLEPINITSDKFEILSGNMIFINTDKDSLYDLVIITSYKNYVVSSVDIDNSIVFGKYMDANGNVESVELASNTNDYDLSIIKDKEEIEIADISEWDVVSVAQSKNTTGKGMRKAFVYSETIDGQVMEIEMTSDTQKPYNITIDGEVYKVAQSYINAGNRTFILNDEGRFFLDIDGRIAGADIKANGGMKYGYLMTVYAGKSVDNKCQFKVLTEGNEFKIFDAADDIIFTSAGVATKTKAADVVKALTDTSSGKDATARQLIMYKIDSNDKITDIAKAVDSTGTGSDDAQFSLDVSGSLFNNYRGPLFVDYGFGPTFVFKVNPDKFDTDEKNYKVLKTNYFSQSDAKWFKVKLYDVVEYVPAVIVDEVTITESETPDNYASLFIVSAISSALNEDGENIYNITGFRDGKEVTYSAEDNLCYAQSATGWVITDHVKKGEDYVVQVGDILLFNADSDKKITTNKMLICTKDMTNVNDPVNYRHDLRIINGTIAKGTIQGGGVSIIMNYTDSSTQVLKQRLHKGISPKSQKLYKYNMQTQKVSLAKIEDFTVTNRKILTRQGNRNTAIELIVFIN